MRRALKRGSGTVTLRSLRRTGRGKFSARIVIVSHGKSRAIRITVRLK